MQLSTPETIRILLASIAQPVRGSRRRGPAETSLKPVRAHKIQGCPRGCTCRTCCDNARWERIFQEKFADPSYYSNPSTRNGSSLSDCWRLKSPRAPAGTSAGAPTRPALWRRSGSLSRQTLERQAEALRQPNKVNKVVDLGAQKIYL